MNRRRMLAGLASLPLLLAAGCRQDCTWAEPDGEPCDGDRDEPCVCTAPDGQVLDVDDDQSAWRIRHKPAKQQAPARQPVRPAPQPVRPAPPRRR